MMIQPFSDPELYLLKNWASVTLLERSIKAVRVKYAETLDIALDKVKRQHKELDRRVVHPTDKWKFKAGIGSMSWPSMYPTWPSGFWIGCIGLRHLVSEDGNAPYACIWLNPPKSANIDLKAAAKKLHGKAKTILPQEQGNDVGQSVKKNEADIWYPLTEPRAKILEMVLNNQSQQLINFILAQFETMAGFIPVMDEIVAVSKRK